MYRKPGVGALSGGPGSVTTSGSSSGLEVGVVTADAVGESPISQFGSGFDVTTVGGARIVKPLTLTLEAVAPAPGLVPLVSHLRHDGAWEYLAPTWDGKTATLRTADFSPNLLGWFNPREWFGKLKANAITFMSGRTPAPVCRGGAHVWGTYSSNTDMVHSCLVSNDDGNGERVELQVTSNRGEFVQIDVPAADYVWVDGQSTQYRRLVGSVFGIDGDRSVLLGPGQRMTIGLRRPAAATSAAVVVTASIPALTMSLIDSLVSLAGEDISGDRDSMLKVVAWCAGKDAVRIAPSGHVDYAFVWSVLGCAVNDAPKSLAQPETALAIAKGLMGQSLDSATLGEQARRLTAVGGKLVKAGFVLKTVAWLQGVRDVIMAGWGSASDQLVDLLTGSQGNSISLNLTGAPASHTATATAPDSPTPPKSTPPAPPPSPSAGNGRTNPTFTGGYTIADTVLGGTWPRTDPNDGTWYARTNRPANAASYWWANGLGVGFSCGAHAAAYAVHFDDGHVETWTTWLRSTDTWGGRVIGLWVPSAVADKVYVDGIPPGMPTC